MGTSGKHKQPESSTKTWAQLTTSEKAAYTVLGYTETNWSKISQSKTKWESFVVSTGTTIALTRTQAAALLGFTQASWDNMSGKHKQPESSTKTWAQLTTSEKAAYTVLGYTETNWSKISQSKTKWESFVVSTGTTIALTRTQAAALLGFIQASWDNMSGKHKQPES